MNAKTMAVVLDRLDEKTEAICHLKELIRDTEAATSKLKTLIGCGNLTPAQTEEAIKRMSFERTTLETNHKQHVELASALATCPLPRNAAEPNPAYALRVGEALKDAKLQWEHDQRRIAQLEKRESELNELHDTIEALPGFPMQPEEKYAEYLKRLAVDRAHHADERSKLFTELEHLKASSARRDKLQGMQDEIREWILQVEQARKERDKAREEATTAIAEREHFRAKWDASLKSRDSAQDEARRTRETNEALQGQLTAVVADNAKQRQLDRVISEATLRTALLVVKCLHSCAELGVIIDASDWGDECGRVIEMAKAATDDDDLILEADFAEKWASRISDPMKRCARLATEHTALLNRVSSVSRLEGELSLHLQIIARLMMQPTIAPMINALEWNGSAQQVLKVARGMFGDVQDVLVTKEPQ